MILRLISMLGISLGMTTALELAFAAIVGVRGAKELTLTALVNVVTNPVVVLCHYIFKYNTRLPMYAVIFVLEAAAVLAEWVLYKKLSESIGRPFLFSLCANAFSFGTGLAVNFLF